MANAKNFQKILGIQEGRKFLHAYYSLTVLNDRRTFTFLLSNYILWNIEEFSVICISSSYQFSSNTIFCKLSREKVWNIKLTYKKCEKWSTQIVY